MSDARKECLQLYRVWIARCENWQPQRWDDLPPRAQAVEPLTASGVICEDAVTWEAAAHLLAGFNEVMLSQAGRFWAIAVPVSWRLDGDAAPSDLLSRGALPLGRSAGQTAGHPTGPHWSLASAGCARS